MRAGRLRHRIILEDKTEVQDEYGEPDYTWSTLAEVWGAVEPLLGRQFLEARVQGQEVSHRIKIRGGVAVTPEMRARFGSRIFEIESVIDVQERGVEMVLMCQELV
ncbi:MAG: phage head closure protein [bacterium]